MEPVPSMDSIGSPEADASPPVPPGKPAERRRFIKTLLGLSAGSMLFMVLTPIIGFLIPPKTNGASGGAKVLAGTTDDIPPGNGKVVAMGSKPVIVINDGAKGVKAFSAVCTHLGCIVGYDSTLSLVTCPCHGGQFNPLSGDVVAGPPPAALPPVNVSVEKNQIYLLSS